MRLRDFLARRRAYAVWLAFAAAAYAVTWSVDPYVFGVAFLGLAPLSGVVAVCGLVAAVRSRDAARRRGVGVLALLIAGVSIAAFAALRTIRWA